MCEPKTGSPSKHLDNELALFFRDGFDLVDLAVLKPLTDFCLPVLVIMQSLQQRQGVARPVVGAGV